MSRAWKLAVLGCMSLAIVGVSGQVRAQTILAPSVTAGQTYTYGDTTFKFTACSVACGNLELIGIMNGRGGTEIEVEEKTSISSYIFTNNSSNQSLNFSLTVGMNSGSRGISSVTNIVNGTDGGTPSDDGKVTSVLSNISTAGAVTVGAGTLTSALNAAPAVAASWPIQTASFSLKATLDENPCSGCNTLRLTNVALLFKPAPEPASIALFATALVGLAAARRRFDHRAKD
jgi:hypothetical protein